MAYKAQNSPAVAMKALVTYGWRSIHSASRRAAFISVL